MIKNKYLNHDLPAGSLKNKTGEWRTERPVVDKSRCIDCATCESYCPEDCIRQFDSIKTKSPSLKGKYYEADFDYCKGCGICVEVCPVKCISMEKEE
jgi:2-oxoacid:acceptor oxidoreductase delta subunit (pyruvate/2-ketoisovalerate family)